MLDSVSFRFEWPCNWLWGARLSRRRTGPVPNRVFIDRPIEYCELGLDVGHGHSFVVGQSRHPQLQFTNPSGAGSGCVQARSRSGTSRID